MELITPGLGLIFWMTLAFLLLVYILGKFAWKPILQMLKERETSIHEALNAANQARDEMKLLQFSNEKLLQDAKNERDALLNEARKIREKMIEDARIKAGEEAARIVEAARASIQNEKMAAMTELKNQIAESSLTLAKFILKRELADPKRQEEYVQELIKEIKFN
ncbi:MAG: F0F1 ATP synthase subunit B [Bacteroidetes bacterium]|nr:F0F1 ATP synthase subunit B [Bacteroidota bacterium]